MRKKLWRGICTVALTGLMSTTVLAAQGRWVGDNGRWWYDNGDGTYKQNGWHWIDGNNDGSAECYYFDAAGWMLANCKTPDGYTVDSNGAWVENGIIQTKNVAVTQNNVTDEPKYTGEFYSVTQYGANHEARLVVTDNGNNTYNFKYVNAQGDVWWEYNAEPLANSGDIDSYYSYYQEFAEVGNDWPYIALMKNQNSNEYYYGWGGEYWDPLN